LIELRDLAVELEGLSLHACSASVETMGLSAEQVAEGGLDGVMSTPHFLREFEDAALLLV
jgi:peroxiredoxin family protein